MPDHSTDAAPVATRAQLRADRSSGPDTGHRPRTDWRLGGRTVFRWREWLLASALISLGVAILAGTLVGWLWQSPWAAASVTALLWAGMLVPVVRAFSLSRPAGLLRLRALDVLYAVVLGGMLRIAQGWIAQVGEGSAGFPSYPLVNGSLGDLWWLTDGLGVVVVAPAIEEFFFRAVILVSMFTILRRPLGTPVAGLIAVVTSAAVFVIVHSMTLGASLDQLVATGLLGLVCGALVMLTGRIWGAVLVHAVFNATFVVLALVGTFAA